MNLSAWERNVKRHSVKNPAKTKGSVFLVFRCVVSMGHLSAGKNPNQRIAGDIRKASQTPVSCSEVSNKLPSPSLDSSCFSDICMSICTCMHTHVEARGQPQLLFLRRDPVISSSLFCERWCLTGLEFAEWQGWLTNRPRDLPVSTSPALGLQTHAVLPGFCFVLVGCLFVWPLGFAVWLVLFLSHQF